ncbi:MAG: tellurite resistance/C4-dicarboxylate transporter family protein [Caulobacteraceae bacterium]|nr:tellurite resistance/C4-dicarboxylate transporter family protein [Caulobacteraceae bacterium]
MGPAEIRSESLVATLRREVAGLSPAYFALVMATGIFSIGVTQLGAPILGAGLYALNIGLYVLLAGLTALRIAWFAPDVLADLTDHRRSVGFFTVVAATNILGSQCLLIGGGLKIAVALWVVGLMLWAGLTYAIFVTLTVKSEKPPLNEGITGAWLLAIVATQSVALLSALLAAHWPQPYRLELNFLALSMWLWGGMFYIWMISLIFYRYTFFAFSPDDLSPPYWINMGAMAISVLAGARLVENTAGAPLLQSVLPFLKGFTVFYWATGTWWIPMLLLLGIWRHVYRRFPLRYDPSYWGAVFPLGMYTVCTLQLAKALKLDFLLFIPRIFIFIAALAWCLAFAGLLHRLWTRVALEHARGDAAGTAR